MGLSEFLFPQEEIKYQSPHHFQRGGEDYVLYITNRRIIGHEVKGLILKKDRVFSLALQEITNLDYKEKGRLHKKGTLTIETHTKKEKFEGVMEDVKVLWREIQSHLGFHEALGTGESLISEGNIDPLKILDTRLATGEITPEEYAVLKKTMNR